MKDGTALVAEKPETEAVVKEKLEFLKKMWDELESTTQTKAQCLFDANRAELFTQSCADLDKWLSGLQGQIQSDDFGKDLTSVNILLKKQQVLYDPHVQLRLCSRAIKQNNIMVNGSRFPEGFYIDPFRL